MSNIPVARRYARALLDAAGAQADTALDQLESLSAYFAAEPELFAAMSSPALARAQRMALTEAVIVSVPGLLPIVVNLLKLMTDRNRFDVLPFLTRQYRDLVDLRVGRVRGVITSARALDDAQVRGIKLSLEAMTQRSVVLEASVDASLLGGVVAQVGSKVYDGSLKAQLKDLSQTLSRPVR